MMLLVVLAKLSEVELHTVVLVLQLVLLLLQLLLPQLLLVLPQLVAQLWLAVALLVDFAALPVAFLHLLLLLFAVASQPLWLSSRSAVELPPANLRGVVQLEFPQLQHVLR